MAQPRFDFGKDGNDCQAAMASILAEQRVTLHRQVMDVIGAGLFRSAG
jgi:hypothetical protein